MPQFIGEFNGELAQLANLRTDLKILCLPLFSRSLCFAESGFVLLRSVNYGYCCG